MISRRPFTLISMHEGPVRDLKRLLRGSTGSYRLRSDVVCSCCSPKRGSKTHAVDGLLAEQIERRFVQWVTNNSPFQPGRGLCVIYCTFRAARTYSWNWGVEHRQHRLVVEMEGVAL